MANWNDGPEYAPRTQPNNFTEPEAETIDFIVPKTDPLPDYPQNPPAMIAPQNVVSLTEIDSLPTSSRNPQEKFEVGLIADQEVPVARDPQTPYETSGYTSGKRNIQLNSSVPEIRRPNDETSGFTLQNIPNIPQGYPVTAPPRMSQVQINPYYDHNQKSTKPKISTENIVLSKADVIKNYAIIILGITSLPLYNFAPIFWALILYLTYSQNNDNRRLRLWSRNFTVVICTASAISLLTSIRDDYFSSWLELFQSMWDITIVVSVISGIVIAVMMIIKHREYLQ